VEPVLERLDAALAGGAADAEEISDLVRLIRAMEERLWPLPAVRV
jgi:hypothetical protein